MFDGPPSRPSRILLIDERDDVRAQVAAGLRATGFLVSECASAESASASLSEMPFEAVVFDPGSKLASDVEDEVRDAEQRANVAVVALTGDRAGTMTEPTSFDYVAKLPLDVTAFAFAVANVVAARRAPEPPPSSLGF